MYYVLLTIAFLLIGLIIGWMGSERYTAYAYTERHVFEDLFESNPHPEIFDDSGNVYRGDYYVIDFDPDMYENIYEDEDM